MAITPEAMAELRKKLAAERAQREKPPEPDKPVTSPAGKEEDEEKTPFDSDWRLKPEPQNPEYEDQEPISTDKVLQPLSDSITEVIDAQIIQLGRQLNTDLREIKDAIKDELRDMRTKIPEAVIAKAREEETVAEPGSLRALWTAASSSWRNAIVALLPTVAGLILGGTLWFVRPSINSDNGVQENQQQTQQESNYSKALKSVRQKIQEKGE